MSITISIPTTIDNDALIAEVPSYYAEITKDQAARFAAIVKADPFPTEVYNDEQYDVHVPAFGLGMLSDESIEQVRELFADTDALPLIEQILEHRIQVYVTEALGLGHGRYMLSRVAWPADDVDMNLANGNFSHLWSTLGLNPGDGETCGEADLDTVEQALDERDYLIGNPHYASRLRQVVAYGRQVGASQLCWA